MRNHLRPLVVLFSYALSAHASVTPAGSYATGVPIEVPRYHGLEPPLQLSYDSDRGNGWLGVGWELSGLSVVQRASSGKGVPAYDGGDIFLLDGLELYPCVSGSPSPGCSNPSGASGQTYWYTRIESYRRIAFDGSNWHVWTQSGTHLVYGARWNAPSQSAPFRWFLSSATDVSGNSVSYNYWRDQASGADDALYLDTITYNGNTIRFYREPRQDTWVSAAMGAGALSRVRYRLKTIDVLVGGSRARTYALSYQNGGRSRRDALSSIQQFGRDAYLDASGTVTNSYASRLPPTSLLLTGGGSPTALSSRSTTPASPADFAPAQYGYQTLYRRTDGYPHAGNQPWNRTFTMDVNGDGLADQVVLFQKYDPNNYTNQFVTVSTLLANVSGGYTAVADYTAMGTRYDPANHYFVGDVDGDGKQDLMVVQYHHMFSLGDSDPGACHYAVSTLRFTNEASPRVYTEASQDLAWDLPNQAGCFDSNPLLNVYDDGWLAADVNGDGKSDFVWARSEGNYRLRTVLSTGVGFDLSVADQLTDWSAAATNRWFVGDVNGDRRADLMHVAYRASPSPHTTLCMALALAPRVTDFQAQPYTLRCFDQPAVSWRDGDWWLPGDANGDGRTDFMRVWEDLANNGASNFQSFLVQGAASGIVATPSLAWRGWSGNDSTGQVPYCPTSPQSGWGTADLDGDGRSDFVQFHAEIPSWSGAWNSQTMYAWIHPSAGGQGNNVSYVAEDLYTDLPTYGVPTSCSSYSLDIGDVNGDGRADVVQRIYDATLDSWKLRVSLQNKNTLDAQRWLRMEVNGDSRDDLVYVHPLETGVRIYTRIRDYGAWTAPAPQDFWTSGTPTFYGANTPSFQAGDLDGDGRHDLVYVRESADGTQLSVFSLLSNGNGTWRPGYQENLASLAGVEHGLPGNWRLIDLDGDGRADLVHVSRWENAQHAVNLRVHALISRGDGTFTVATQDVWPNYANGDDLAWRPADVNGDGRADLVHFARNSVTGMLDVDSLLSNGNGTWRTASAHFAYDHFSHPAAWMPVSLNGDGAADFVRLYAQPNQGFYDVKADLLVGTGDGGAAYRSQTVWPGFDSPDAGWLPVDLNGDGRTDLVHPWFLAPGLRVDELLAEASGGDDGFLSAQVANALPGHVFADVQRWRPSAPNGDGKLALERVYTQQTNTIQADSLFPDSSFDRLGMVTTPLGAQTSISYGVSSTVGAFNSPSGGRPLPAGVVRHPVTWVGIHDGRDSSPWDWVMYGYDGPAWSYAERGFIGWSALTSYHFAASNRPYGTQRTSFALGDACGAHVTDVQSKDQNGKLLTEESAYNFPPTTSPPYDCRPRSKWSYDCDPSGTCKSSYTGTYPDVYGNPSWIYEYGDLSLSGDERTTSRQYLIQPSTYIVTLAKEIVYQGVGSATRLAETDYCYDGTGLLTACNGQASGRGLVSAELQWNDRTNAMNARHYDVYDAWGNHTQIIDPNGSVTTIDYDYTYHVYPVTTHDALDHIADTAWDFVLGLPLYSVDVNRQWKDSHSYDALGRLRGISNPDTSYTSWDYLNWGNPNQQYILTTVADGSTSGLWTRDFIDGLSRTYASAKKGATGEIWQTRTYGDSSGRVWQETHAYAGPSSLPQPTEVSQYDAMGRLISVTHPDNSSRTITYGAGHALSTDENGHYQDRFFDAWGRVSSVTEPDGTAATVTTRYTWDLLGRLTAVTDPGANITHKVFDSLGRVVQTIDPDLGAWSYTYDGADNLLTRTDARNQTVTFTYDALNRRKTKTNSYDSMVITWNYDQGAHAVGMLSSIADTSVAACASADNIGYDVMQRPAARTKCLDGISYSTSSAFDRAGRLSSITYPDQELVTYHYDAAGRLVGPDSLVTAMSYDPAGHLTGVTLNNGVTESFAYDSRREWLTDALVASGEGNLFQVHYGYQTDGLTNTSTSLTHALNSTYGYDLQHRLTSVSGDNAQSLTYNGLGNLLSNSRVGTYRYPLSGPLGCGREPCSGIHAALAAGPKSMAYDDGGNLWYEVSNSDYDRIYYWDAESRLVSLWTNSPTQGWRSNYMSYDADGRRVKKTDAVGATTYYFSDLVGRNPQGQLVKYYFAGPRLVARREGATLYYHHQDRLGSTRVVTDAGGRVVSGGSYNYGAFGTLSSGGNGELASGILFSGARQDAGTARARGDGADLLNGLVYMNARYYDPITARMISADTVIPDVFNLQALNRYSYAYNNPISNIDPTGHSPEDWEGEAPIAAPLVPGAPASNPMLDDLPYWPPAAPLAPGAPTSNPALDGIPFWPGSTPNMPKYETTVRGNAPKPLDITDAPQPGHTLAYFQGGPFYLALRIGSYGDLNHSFTIGFGAASQSMGIGYSPEPVPSSGDALVANGGWSVLGHGANGELRLKDLVGDPTFEGKLQADILFNRPGVKYEQGKGWKTSYEARYTQNFEGKPSILKVDPGFSGRMTWEFTFNLRDSIQQLFYFGWCGVTGCVPGSN